MQLSNCLLSDETLGALENLQLTELNLGLNRWLNEGLAHLRKLPITNLDLGFNARSATNAGVAHLWKLPLFTLDLENCSRLTDAGVGQLRKLPWLTKLNLGNCDGLSRACKQEMAGYQVLWDFYCHERRNRNICWDW